MIIQPAHRGYICLTAHPRGCEQNVMDQITHVTSKGALPGPRNVLIIGASTGFGLSSRITSAFGSGAATIGVFYEKPAADGKTASPGWYNTAAFHREAKKKGLYARSINGDAFSDSIKHRTIECIKRDLGKVDLVIYSIASSVRVHPDTGVLHRSTLKPIGHPFTSKTVDIQTGEVNTTTLPAATDEDVHNTVTVMGGDDWQRWITALLEADALSTAAMTVAYSYIGSALTEAIYRKGTIGRAKDHLENSVRTINDHLAAIQGTAFVSVNKALVTQASAAIPVIPLYIALLFKAMIAKGIHEGCIEQICRLYRERLFCGSDVPTDDEGRIRIDDWEMRDDIQKQVATLWEAATTATLPEIGDLELYRSEFLKLFGFGRRDIDYHEECCEVVAIDGLEE